MINCPTSIIEIDIINSTILNGEPCVGCGVGRFLAYVARLGIDCAGVEPSKNAVKYGKQYLPCDIHVGMMTEDIFHDQKFDVTCSWDIIEHVADLRLFLQAIKQRLKPGGFLYLSTPNYDCSWIWGDMEADPRSRPPVHLKTQRTTLGFQAKIRQHENAPQAAHSNLV